MNSLIRVAMIPLTAFGVSIAFSSQAASPKTIVAVFSQKDPTFSENVTLYSDGKYEQSEMQLEAFPGDMPLHHAIFQMPAPWASNPKREGVWRLLEREGGTPIVVKPGAVLPSNAVIEIKGAMPFGMTWDNMLPSNLHGDRTIPTVDFHAALPPMPGR